MRDMSMGSFPLSSARLMPKLKVVIRTFGSRKAVRRIASNEGGTTVSACTNRNRSPFAMLAPAFKAGPRPPTEVVVLMVSFDSHNRRDTIEAQIRSPGRDVWYKEHNTNRNDREVEDVTDVTGERQGVTQVTNVLSTAAGDDTVTMALIGRSNHTRATTYVHHRTWHECLENTTVLILIPILYTYYYNTV